MRRLSALLELDAMLPGPRKEKLRRFLHDPDPVALLRHETKRGRALFYTRPPSNQLSGGAWSTIMTWEGMYVRFALVKGKYPQQRSEGVHTRTPVVAVPYQQVSVPMQHALAGWMHMRLTERLWAPAEQGMRPGDAFEVRVSYQDGSEQVLAQDLVRSDLDGRGWMEQAETLGFAIFSELSASRIPVVRVEISEVEVPDATAAMRQAAA